MDPADAPESDDAEARSVFGQLRRQMASRADARGLRRSFVHMQDGGQPRAFYVKFVGEGVDDHGGQDSRVYFGDVDGGGCTTLSTPVHGPGALYVVVEGRVPGGAWVGPALPGRL